jgi:FlaA1/EpsC-like NDP-sugar epimerase
MLKPRTKKVLIVGAGVAGRDVAKEIKANPELGLRTIGFIDDNLEVGVKVDGYPVLGKRSKLATLLKSKKINQVIIAIPSAEGSSIAEYVKICSNARVAARIVPRVKEIIEGKAHIGALREVRVEDLLGRPVVKADVNALHDFFKNKTVLITGAAGSIGSELSRQVAAYKPKKIVLLDWWENGLFDIQQELLSLFPKADISFVICNIQDKLTLESVFSTYHPDIVFHAAAYKHVPLMEQHPDQAVSNNVFGTLNVATLSKKFKAQRFVLISTDKAASPVSVMGATKLITEGIGKKLNGETKYMAVRFGNVLDSFGSVIPTFKKQIAKGGPVTITDKRMTRYFMTIPEAAQLILKAAQMGDGGELFVLDMGEPVKITDLAENLIRLSGLIPGKDIEITYTGKRPGEKLREKLLNTMEVLLPTQDTKISKTQSFGFDIKKLDSSLIALEDHLKEGNKVKIVKEIAKLIPSFKVR